MLSRVRLFVTPWTVAHQAPPSMGILQARILEWVAMPSSRGSSPPRDRTHISGVSGIHSDSLAPEPSERTLIKQGAFNILRPLSVSEQASSEPQTIKITTAQGYKTSKLLEIQAEEAQGFLPLLLSSFLS